MKNLKKLISAMIVVSMILSIFAMCDVASFAEETIAIGSCGKQGDNVKWSLNSEGLLTISGIGDMREYGSYNYPWSNAVDRIKSIVIEDGVTSIGTYAFYTCRNLLNITFSKDMTSIPWSSVRSCTSLERVVIPNNITEIAAEAFSGCENLKQIVMSENLKSIGWQAFLNCRSLESIVLPASLESIAVGSLPLYDTFSGCYNLKEIYNFSNLPLSCGNTDYGSVAFYAIAIHDDLSLSLNRYSYGDFSFVEANNDYYLVNYSGDDYNVILPENPVLGGKQVDEYIVAAGAFYCNKQPYNALRSITISKSVSKIEDDAFVYCSKLIEIYNNSSLQITAGDSDNGRVAVNAEVVHTDMNEQSILFDYNDYIFYESDGQYYLIDYIGDSKNLEFPENPYFCDDIISTYEIGNHSFIDTDIESIKISKSVSSIGYYAFSNCEKLHSIEIDEDVDLYINFCAFRNCKALTYLYLPEGVEFDKTDENDTFYGCVNLRAVVGAKVYDYSPYVFSHCPKLKKYSSLDEFYNSNDFIFVDDYVFYKNEEEYTLLNYNGALNETISLPPEIIIDGEIISSYNVGSYLFPDNDIVEKVVFPTSVKSLSVLSCNNCLNIFEVRVLNSECKITDSRYGYDDFNFLIVSATENSTFKEFADEYSLIFKKIICDQHTEEIVRGYDATCTQSGLSDGVKCSVCAEVIEEQVIIEPLGHKEEVVKGFSATCTTSGMTDEIKCSECNEIFEKQVIIPATGHHYNAIVTAPTCTNKGYSRYVCVCGDDYYDDIIDATGHIDEDADNICDVCDEVLSTQTPDTDDGGESGENNSSDGISSFFASIKELFNRIISWFRTIFGMV